MGKVFNTTAVCIPEKHYMVDITERLNQIKALVDEGKYFTINRARQYGKTTTLLALKKMLEKEYDVIMMDFRHLEVLILQRKIFLRCLLQILFSDSLRSMYQVWRFR